MEFVSQSIDWYLKCIKNNYANFNGRARRQEYWMFTLVNMVVAIAISIVAGIFGAMADFLGTVFMIVYYAYALAVLVPGIAVAIRRLHDTNRSGWWLLIALIPLAGLVLIYFLCLDSDPETNQYGPNPKA